MRKHFKGNYSLDTSYLRPRDSFRNVPDLSQQLGTANPTSTIESINSLAMAEAG